MQRKGRDDIKVTYISNVLSLHLSTLKLYSSVYVYVLF